MPLWLWIVIILVALLLLGAVLAYNRLVALRARVNNGWSQIDVQLRRRYDLIPNLVKTVQGYATHEREVFENVTQARSRAIDANAIPDQADAENHVTRGLRQLMAVAENYPELKADNSFRHLQSRITELEEAIADRRELYNESVNLNNIRLQTFPDLIVARQFAFQQASLLEFAEEQRRDVNLEKLFG